MNRLRATAALLLTIALTITAVVEIGGTAVNALPAPTPAAACWERDYNDEGLSKPQTTFWSLRFTCPSARFTLTVKANESFPIERSTDYLRFWASTGAGTGCDGFDRMVAGQFTLTGTSGTAYSTPSCDPDTWAAIDRASFVLLDQRNLALSFDFSVIGHSSFEWFAQTRLQAPEFFGSRFPRVGSVLASGVPYYPGATSGYWLTDAFGGVHAFGNAQFYGDLEGKALAAPIVGMAPIPQRDGYWVLGRDGGVFSFGAAHFYGSTGAIRLNQPIVGMAATRTGRGYWFVGADGGIFSYGDAAFYGSTGAIALNQPIVGMAATPSGHGYWLVAADGGVFGFGDAAFYGSTGGIALHQPIVAMASTNSGHGYWLVAADGGIFSFGDAGFFGSTGHLALVNYIVGMAPSPNGDGYRLGSAEGGIFSLGDAPFYGSLFDSIGAHVVAIS